MKVHASASLNVLICACVMLAAFFMPWVQFFGMSMSGYNLGSLGSYGNYAWVIPILAGATIVASFIGNNRMIGAISGIVPIVAIAYALIRISEKGGSRVTESVLDAAEHFLSIGAWLTILVSIAIVVISVTGKKETANANTNG